MENGTWSIDESQLEHMIVTKVFVNRLKLFLLKWVLPNQVSFVSGRNLVDNIIIAQEIIHSMRSNLEREDDSDQVENCHYALCYLGLNLSGVEWDGSRFLYSVSGSSTR
ncbi:Retrovirus-related Pol polyprotein LINE-1 [Gossypium australe]|uniref:Retrovirus-related Pol polyprotein LINE-1 n=1 Tax=Gossypium australe TaxID=47621 RepID=A0A5B6W718_9ROSI|nr:Retrovirus-related Pol polyprotein LINE-1 [Gossypium australe]